MRASIKRVIKESFGEQISVIKTLYNQIIKKIRAKQYELSFIGTQIISLNILFNDNVYELDFVVKRDTDKQHGYIDNEGNISIYATKEDFEGIKKGNIPSEIENALKHELSHLYDMIKNVSFEDEDQYRSSTRKKFKDEDLRYFFSRSEVYADLSTAISSVIRFFNKEQMSKLLPQDFAAMVLDEYEKNIKRMGGSYVYRNIPEQLKKYILKRASMFFKDKIVYDI